jgi:hypothetical protein
LVTSANLDNNRRPPRACRAEPAAPHSTPGFNFTRNEQAMPINLSNRTERLIAEPLSLRLGIDRPGTPAVTGAKNIAAPNLKSALLPPETQRIVNALYAICAAPPGTIVMWYGRPHTFVPPHYANPDKGTQLIGRPGAERAAQIVLAPVDQPAQHLYAKFAVIRNGKAKPGDPPFFLECEGNPTTLIAGNNVLPVTSRDGKSQKLEPFPSSAHRMMTTLNRVLFRFLEDIAGQVIGNAAGLFAPATRQAIDSGDFAVVHIQWCCYLRADPSRFSRVLVALFAPPMATEVGFSSLAREMGLDFSYQTDERSTRVKSALLERRHGKNKAWSATAYNKRARVGQMRQGKTLDSDEAELIDNHVRFDMTAHPLAVMEMIGDARRFLMRCRETFPTFLEHSRTKEFLSKTPEPTARWLEFAVYILSHRHVAGKMRRGSFADYLVPKVIDDVLHLSSIVCCTVDGLRAFEQLPDSVAKAWREGETYDAKGWVARLCQAGRCQKSKVYQLRDTWLREFNVDIAIPRAFYRDLLVYAPTSLMLPEDRDALLNARSRRDGEKTLRILDDADGNFFAQMTAVVGGAVQSPPLPLPAKVMGELAAIQGEERPALPAGGASATVPQLASKALPRSRGSAPRGKVQQPTAPYAVGQKRADPPSRPGSGLSTAPKTKGRARAPKRELWLPEGIGDQSSFHALHEAIRDLNRRMKADPPEDELRDLMEQRERVQDLIVHRQDRIRRQQQTRRENKAAARLKRMGGRVRPSPSPPQK